MEVTFPLLPAIRIQMLMHQHHARCDVIKQPVVALENFKMTDDCVESLNLSYVYQSFHSIKCTWCCINDDLGDTFGLVRNGHTAFFIATK